MKHFLDIADFTVKQLNSIIKTAKQIKKSPKQFTNRCKGKTLGMIFEKDSTRTRVSFNVGFQKLGGHVVELKSNEIGFGKRESYEDVLQTLSQFIDCLMIRNDDHKIIRRLSSLNALPIINGLSNYSHPCQILSDLFTINESIGGIKNKQIAWIGDYNNVLRSLIQLQNLYQFKLNIVMPKEILKQNKSKIIKSINKNFSGFNIFNICSSKLYSIKEIISITEKLANSHISVEYNSEKFDEKCLWGDNSKAKLKLNFEPKISLNSGIKKILDN